MRCPPIFLAIVLMARCAAAPHLPYDSETETPCCLLDNAFEPIRSTILFFDKCPSEISNQTVCEAVGRALGVRDSALYVSRTSAFEVTPPPSPDLAPKVHFTDSYDVAVVSAGFCFSIYPNVKYGQEVSLACTDAAFVDDVLSVFEFSSIWTPGDFYYDSASVFASQGVYIGGNWEGVLPFFVNTGGGGAQPNLGGCFPTHPLVIGGDVILGTQNDIISAPFDEGVSVALGGRDPDGRIAQPIQYFNKQEVATTKFELSVKACTLSKMIQSQKSNGSATLTVQSDVSGELVITCPGNEPFCIVALEEAFLLGLDITINVIVEANGAEVVKVNVPGLTQVASLSFTRQTVIPYVWNFYEADHVVLSAGLGYCVGSFLAPRASKFIMECGFIVGTVIMGHPESHLSLLSLVEIDQFSTTLYCPPPEPSIVLCDCLCRKKKDKKYSL